MSSVHNTKFCIKIKNIPSLLESKNTFEFHIALSVRKKYNVKDHLFTTTGNVILPNFRAVRDLAANMNKNRSEGYIQPGQLNAMALLDEIYHYVIRVYEEKMNPKVFSRAIEHLRKKVGIDTLQNLLFEFTEIFPPYDVYKGKLSAQEYLNSFSYDKSNYETVLEELILLYFANFNPANAKLKELFDEKYIKNNDYKNVIAVIETFFENEKPFEKLEKPLFTLLKEPIINNPNDLEAQLKYIQDSWEIVLEENFKERILSGVDLIKEDVRFAFFGGGGGAPTVVPQYGKGKSSNLSIGKSSYKYADDEWKDYLAPEKFTKDIEWMPNVVMIAKNAYVWLDQLSKKYQRHIKTLGDVPDEELDMIRSWNINSLWLIGLWERSSASQKIKQIMGNPDAAASAYSLFDYVIADDLGGEDAFNNLDNRCKMRGIRLASDMVPNHVGIFSKWVLEHPEYFVQTEFPPFPNYKFTGENLSEDSNFDIRIEDGYWSKSDASVVFQRIDKRTGEVRYFYHGNDGTNMPWNDTAQLNLLNPEVREALIQTIFHVARKTSIIRFDAAMTLTKKHYQRLWFPKRGSGGDIPSRADYALSQEEFDNAMPNEFWREVVDRINAEMPHTLLLAEAFWLMEGYFVRTLGMHRVYNSAFMNMFKKEENDKYRDLITNTLEFNPEILKRYVNFMSNPDEETAIRQFGTDGKYFGTSLVMATLPGLPMIAHGQIEGYNEKYGMEYKRAYYNELPNQWLIDRHKREIFPVLAKRYIFSEVKNFWFFDFINTDSNVNENVFAYFNAHGNEKAVVFYNNKYEDAKGWIKYSTQKLVTLPDGNRAMQNIKISDAMGVKYEDDCYYIFREHISGLEFIRTGKEICDKGIYVELGAFKYLLFWNFREVKDTNGDYKQVYESLNGAGCDSIDDFIKYNKLQPVHSAFLNMFDEYSLKAFTEFAENEEIDLKKLKNIIYKYELFACEALKMYDIDCVEKITDKNIQSYYDIIFCMRYLYQLVNDKTVLSTNAWISYLKNYIFVTDAQDIQIKYLLYSYSAVLRLRELFASLDIDVIKEFALERPLELLYKRLGYDNGFISNRVLLINIIGTYSERVLKVKNGIISIDTKKFVEILSKEELQLYLMVNEYQGISYFSKENFEELTDWILTKGCIAITRNNFANKKFDQKKIMDNIKTLYSQSEKIINAAVKSGYDIDKLKTNLINEKTSK